MAQSTELLVTASYVEHSRGLEQDIELIMGRDWTLREVVHLDLPIVSPSFSADTRDRRHA